MKKFSCWSEKIFFLKYCLARDVVDNSCSVTHFCVRYYLEISEDLWNILSLLPMYVSGEDGGKKNDRWRKMLRLRCRDGYDVDDGSGRRRWTRWNHWFGVFNRWFLPILMVGGIDSPLLFEEWWYLVGVDGFAPPSTLEHYRAARARYSNAVKTDVGLITRCEQSPVRRSTSPVSPDRMLGSVWQRSRIDQVLEIMRVILRCLRAKISASDRIHYCVRCCTC